MYGLIIKSSSRFFLGDNDDDCDDDDKDDTRNLNMAAVFTPEPRIGRKLHQIRH